MKKYDYVIVGSGLYGSTFNYFAKQLGKKCLIIEKRSQVGGNLFCENINGINVHSFGPHIFHTSNEDVWRFVSSLVPFNNFRLNTLANYKGKLYSLPFNMNTFYQMWGVTDPADAKMIIDDQKYEGEPKNLEEQAISLVGDDIYNILIKGYTEKQWGRDCCDLPCEIIKRLPVRFTFDNNYFNDIYQGVPINGYNVLIKKLIGDTEVILDTDYLSNKEYFDSLGETVVYTGKIDEYFGYQLGELEYRSVIWETEIMPRSNYQGNAIINYTEKDIPYTRIIEHKHFESFNQDVYRNPYTVISKEYPVMKNQSKDGYYPVNDDRNMKLLEQYQELSRMETNVVFGGRLAEYKYYDMDDTIEQVMMYFSANTNCEMAKMLKKC